MPTYTYTCPKCATTTTRFRPAMHKDDHPPVCVSHKTPVPMKRSPA